MVDALCPLLRTFRAKWDKESQKAKTFDLDDRDDKSH
jgi:hypothetical protein